MKFDSKLRFENNKIETKIKNQINQIKHNKSIEADKFRKSCLFGSAEKNSTVE